MPSPSSFDPGLTEQVTGKLRRSVNRDGSFNVHRRGRRFRDNNSYLALIHMSWPKFLTVVMIAFLAVNTIFAVVYVEIGIENLRGVESDSGHQAFFDAFFFSVQTITTVGYGSIAPKSISAGAVASMEAVLGLMGFAIATGILYGRFSRPSAKIVYSDKMLVAPYQNIRSLQFRVANQRSNNLMDLEATVVLMTVEQSEDGNLKRDFKQLELERSTVYFFPLSWTIVHPITDSSPLFGKTAADLEQKQAEIIVMIRAFDESFSQQVFSRFSYRWDEFEWGARFVQAFSIDKQGDLVLELDQLQKIEPAALP